MVRPQRCQKTQQLPTLTIDIAIDSSTCCSSIYATWVGYGNAPRMSSTFVEYLHGALD